MSYNECMQSNGKAVTFDHQIGRVDLHASGMRGAPAKLPGSSQPRPQSAMDILRGGTGTTQQFGARTRAPLQVSIGDLYLSYAPIHYDKI